MVTAAAGSDAAVVLVDVTKLDFARLELLPQTRRHSLLAHLLRVPAIVFAVNKLDAVADPRAAFTAVREQLESFAAEAGFTPAAIVPVSALRGDNVALASREWDWWSGPTLLQLLEQLPAAAEAADGALLLPVQYVARDEGGTGHQPRVFWGRIARGAVRAGDAVRVHGSGESARVVEVRHAGSTVDAAGVGQSAGLVLDRQLDVSRGDWLVGAGEAAGHAEFDATLAWLDSEPAVPGRKYWLRHGHRWIAARITAIEGRLDIHSLAEHPSEALAVNDIGRVRIQAQAALPLQRYADNRVAGALIVVDPASHRTSGALLVREVL